MTWYDQKGGHVDLWREGCTCWTGERRPELLGPSPPKLVITKISAKMTAPAPKRACAEHMHADKAQRLLTLWECTLG